MDLKSKLADKKMGKAPEPKTEMSLDEALAQLKQSNLELEDTDSAYGVKKSTESAPNTLEPKLPEQKGLKDTPDASDALTPKGGLVGRIIRAIVNPGPIQKHNNDLREAQAALVRG